MVKTKVKKIKRETPILHFNCFTEEGFQHIESLLPIQEVVHKGAVEAISYAISENKKVAEIFKLQDYISIVVINKKDWKSTLNNAMMFYAQNDNFDKAIECQNLIGLI